MCHLISCSMCDYSERNALIDPAFLAHACANLEVRARAVGEICFSPVVTKTFTFGDIRADIHHFI